jgi:hypothetical protein
MLLISETPSIVKCFYNQEENCTIHEWLTFFCTPEESQSMRNSLELFLDFVKQHKITKHIVDVKKCRDAFSEEDFAYITNYLVPKEQEYGILYLANITSEDIFSQLSTDFWQEKVENGFLIKNVENMQEALNWFRQK